jgi:hypothetical protein
VFEVAATMTLVMVRSHEYLLWLRIIKKRQLKRAKVKKLIVSIIGPETNISVATVAQSCPDKALDLI